MRLSAPKKNTFYISLVLVVLALLGKYAGVAVLAGPAFLILLVGYIILAAGNYLKGF